MKKSLGVKAYLYPMPALVIGTYNDDGTVSIELHIVVENGVNIATVCRSIMGEVKYVVNLNTGVTVKAVNVCVDSVTV